MTAPLRRLTCLLLAASLTPAGFAFFCPTNFNQIDFGMTIDQVTQACGKPDKQNDSDQPNENVPQEWNYYIPQTVSMGGSEQNATGTLKTTVAFDEQGKAINISVNGIGAGATAICGRNIQLGDTRDTIKAACGDPSFINKQQLPSSSTQPQSTKVTELVYSHATPPATLVFENGVLTSKK